MISYIKFLEKAIKNMQLLKKKQIKINIDKYMENKDIKFLNKNMQKLLRLKQTATKQF